MSLQTKPIKNQPFVYWKKGNQQISMGQLGVVIAILKARLANKSRDMYALTFCLRVLNRNNFADYIEETPRQQVVKDLAMLQALKLSYTVKEMVKNVSH